MARVQRIPWEGEIVETELNESMLPKCNTKVDMKDHATGLKFWEEESCTTIKDDYLKFSTIVRQNLSTVCRPLHSACEASLKSRLEAKYESQSMVKSKRCYEMKFRVLIKK